MTSHDSNNDSPDDFVSKSEQKREIQQITQLGQRLLEVPTASLADYPISEFCLKAILEGQKIKSHIGRKRQIKYIGKLLRQEDLEAIRQVLALQDQQKQLANKQFHELENWRDRLVQEGNPALSDLLDQQPHLDRQQLRQLVRNAQNEIKNNKPPKYQRELFRFLKQHIEQ